MALRTWWSRLTLRGSTADLGFEAKELPMADWHLVRQEADSASWRDVAGDFISLTRTSVPVPSLSDPVRLQQSCRRFSEDQRSGLVDVAVRDGAQGRCLAYVYKRLEMPAFKFVGIVRAP